MNSSPSQHCSVCLAKIDSAYCPNCGQKVGKKNSTITSLFKDLLANLFSIERTWFSGIKWVLKDTNVIVTNYWEGNRGYYPSPGKMIFYALTIAALHVASVEADLLGIRLTDNKNDPQYLFMLIILPLMMVASYFTFLYTDKKFVHHLISVLYTSSSFFILLVVLSDILFFTFKIQPNEYLLVCFAILTFVFNSRVFLAHSNWLKKISFGVIQTLVFTILITLLVGGIGLYHKFIG